MSTKMIFITSINWWGVGFITLNVSFAFEIEMPPRRKTTAQRKTEVDVFEALNLGELQSLLDISEDRQTEDTSKGDEVARTSRKSTTKNTSCRSDQQKSEPSRKNLPNKERSRSLTTDKIKISGVTTESTKRSRASVKIINHPSTSRENMSSRGLKKRAAKTVVCERAVKHGKVDDNEKVSVPAESESSSLQANTFIPTSRARLSVPKKQFSPDPVFRFKTKATPISEKETVAAYLTRLTARLEEVESEDFSLPYDFVLEHKERLSTENEKGDDANITTEGLQNVRSETAVDDKPPSTLTDCGFCEQVSASGSMNEEELLGTDSAGFLPAKPRRGDTFPSIDLDDNDEHLPIMKPVFGKGKMKKKGLIKLKRSKPRLIVLGEDTRSDVAAGPSNRNDKTANSQAHGSTTEGETNVAICGASPFRKHPSPLPLHPSQFFRTELSEVGDASVEDVHSERIEISGDGKIGIVNPTETKTDNTNEESGNIHPVKDADDGKVDGVKESSASEIDVKEDIIELMGNLLSRVCESLPSAPSLVTEPLRRPFQAERRRVPPIRISLPRPREPRERRSPWSRKYSPPLPTSKQQNSRLSDGTPERISNTSSRKVSRRHQKGSHSCTESETPTPKQPSTAGFSSSTQSLPKSPSIFSSGTDDAAIVAAVEDKEIVSEKEIAMSNDMDDKPSGRLRPRKTVHLSELYPSWFRKRKLSKEVQKDEKQSDVGEKPSEKKNYINMDETVVAKTKRKQHEGSGELATDTDSGRSIVHTRKRGKRKRSTRGRGGRSSSRDGSKLRGKRRKTSYIKPPLSLSETKVEKVDTLTPGSGDCSAILKGEPIRSEDNDSGNELDRATTSSEKEHPCEPHGVAISENTNEANTGYSRVVRRGEVYAGTESTGNTAVALLHSVSANESVKEKVVAKPEHPKLRIFLSNRAEAKADSSSFEESFHPDNPKYFQRIAIRRKLNPLAVGLKSRCNDDDNDFFYREILMRGKDLRKDDTEVDVDSVITADVDKESALETTAKNLAQRIVNFIARKNEVDCSDDGDGDGDDGGASEDVLSVDTVQKMFANETPDRRKLLKNLINIVSSQFCTEATSQNVVGGASLKYNSAMKNAHQLRDAMFFFSKEMVENSLWAHRVLVEQLPLNLLPSYILLLKYCKLQPNQKVSELVLHDYSDGKMNMANRMLSNFFDSTALIEPQSVPISKTISRKRRLSNICFILVWPQITAGSFKTVISSHEYLFKTLLPSLVEFVETVRLALPPGVNYSVCEATDYFVRLIERTVNAVHKKNSKIKIVLVGWGTSAILNHRVVAGAPNVSAIINFAFPMKTAEGPRGHADDDILTTYCPSLFIVGERARDCNVRDLQIMATRMRAPSGVIVIGSANTDLQPSTVRLNIERFTNRTVQRALLDDIRDFLKLHCSRASGSRQLHPVKLVEVNDVNLSLLRSHSLFSSCKPPKPNILLKLPAEKSNTLGNISSAGQQQMRKPKLVFRGLEVKRTPERSFLANGQELKKLNIIRPTGKMPIPENKYQGPIRKRRLDQRTHLAPRATRSYDHDQPDLRVPPSEISLFSEQPVYTKVVDSRKDMKLMFEPRRFP